MKKEKICIVFGTRPEAIKMAPIIAALKKDGTFDVRICVTAQHREMLDQVLEFFQIAPDHDLNLMKPDQSLGTLTSEMSRSLSDLFGSLDPAMVLVQGDTTTAFMGALCAFYQKVPVGHIEAGLRTDDIYSPFPEEVNRRLVSVIAKLHFAPTEKAAGNLVAEGVPRESVHVTGNSVIDALQEGLSIIRNNETLRSDLDAWYASLVPDHARTNKRLVLITGHRRESFGAGFESICQAISDLSARFPGHAFVYPVHLNPNVSKPVNRYLGALENVTLIPPVDYARMLYLLSRSYLILTDSGGIQEEAPSLKIPVIVMREKTERPEAMDLGASVLAGCSRERIVQAVSELLTDDPLYNRMQIPRNPYGDGRTAARILSHVKDFLSGS